MGVLHAGTSSWSDRSWVGPFYPPGTRPADYLRHYAQSFGAVEADVTYYRIPDEKMIRGWDERTPPGFRFCAKFPRSIVHGGDGPRPDPSVVLIPERVGADAEAFVTAMRGLGAKCGPLLLQFPYFASDVFRESGEFLERLDRFLGALPSDVRYAVEVRNRAYLGDPLRHILQRHGAALCLSEIRKMPHPDEAAERLDVLTSDFLYARLIGDRYAIEKVTKSWGALVLDQDASLDRWATLLQKFLERVTEVYVFANNHFAGHGPATMRALQERLGYTDAPG